MKLSTRMTLAMVALVVLTALAVGLLAYRNVEATVLPRAAERAELHVRVLAAALAASVRGAREDIAGFQKAVAIAGIVRAHAAGGVDPEGGTEETWRQRLADRFVAELEAKGSYDQFRIIQADGREVVRVDRSGPGGTVRVVPQAELQQKFERPYFTAALATPPGQIYVSPVELNQEHGAIQVPHLPVLRVAERIDMPDGRPFGIVIINVDMRPAFAELAASVQSRTRLFIIDDRGNYLVHPDHSQEFALDLDGPQRWQKDFPALPALFAADGPSSTLFDDRQGEQCLAAVAAVTLAGGPRVGVVEITPVTALMATARAVGRSTLLGALISVLGATALAIVFARSLTRPLVQMTKAVEAFPHSPPVALPAASGEIGVLAGAFARMMAEVTKITATLEKEVAEHRRTEAALARHSDRERLFIAAVKSSNDAIITVTPDGIVTGWNPAATQLFGWSADEMIGRGFEVIVPEERLSEVRNILASVLHGETVNHHETVRLSKAGQRIEVSLSVSPIKLSSGNIIGACKIVRDLTETTRTKERLEREIAERRRIVEVLDNTLNSMSDAVVVGDRDGNIVLRNGAAYRLMRAAVGMKPSQWSHGQKIFMADGVTPMSMEERPLMRAARGESFENYELVVHYPHAEKPYVFAATGGPIRGSSQDLIGGVVVYRDITEFRETERQLRQAQKMESVGQLTGGVAHDFNNILTVITGTIEILEEGVADRPELAAVAKMIDEAAVRGTELTRNLLAFSRRQPLQPRKTNVNELVIETSRLLRPTLGENIEIESMLDDESSPALIDPSQLSTSLLNLAINARDAMPNGGKLTFETRDVVLDESYAAMNADMRPGPYVMIAVSDNGAGIPAAILDKVFEPFFTTKTPGKGTGLGLSMVYGFVKQSEGHIKIYSEEGHGTTIKIYLPRAVDQAEQAPATAPIEPIYGGYETILIVEDDPLVRTYVTAQVKSLGYKTLTATNAAEALALIDSDKKIDLLFTDIVMPGGMNGRQLAEEASRRRPQLKVLFTSGYTENAIVHHGRLDPGVLLLAKPYRKQQLAQMIRAALTAHNSGLGVGDSARKQAV